MIEVAFYILILNALFASVRADWRRRQMEKIVEEMEKTLAELEALKR